MSTHWREVHGAAFSGQCALVTGGAGFIGSHLTEALLELGCRVTVVDDLSGSDGSNLKPFRERFGSQLRFLRGSILDRDLLRDAAEGARCVFHQAALASVPASIADPVAYAQVNIIGTLNVLEAARSRGAHRVLLAASAAAYGDSEEIPKLESMPTQCKSPYAATKVAGEALLAAYAGSYPLDTCSLRYFNIFGPRQNANSAYAAVLAAFAKAVLEQGQPPTIFGDGVQTRDFTFVDNVVHANLLAARSERRLAGAVVNIGCARRITVLELAQRVLAELGHNDWTPLCGPERAGDVKHSMAGIDAARALLGYEPLVAFESGLKLTLDWYREQAKATAAPAR